MHRTRKNKYCLKKTDHETLHSAIQDRGVHRVGRVLSFSQVVGIGAPPTPHPQASVPLPPVLGGGARSLAREGLRESQFRRGDIHCFLNFTREMGKLIHGKNSS
jgi:hypothetical protein